MANTPNPIGISSKQERVFFVDEYGYPQASISMHEMGCLLTTHLLGRILTIIDASIADARQCKAVKDIIKQSMWQTHSDVRMWMCENLHKTVTEYTTFPYTDSRSIE